MITVISRECKKIRHFSVKIFDTLKKRLLLGWSFGNCFLTLSGKILFFTVITNLNIDKIMKKFTLFVICLCAGLTFAIQAKNANNPARGGMPAFIDASIENLDFGDLEVGYSQFRTFTVSGDFLVDDIYLTLEGQGMYAYQVSPATITPEDAAQGVSVRVVCKPTSTYSQPANIRLSSQNAEDVIIPITANPYFPDGQFVDKRTQEFVAPVGGMQVRTGYVRFFDVGLIDPIVVDRSMGDWGDVHEMETGFADMVPICYSLSIEGPDACHFRAILTRGSIIANICDVKIIYQPKASGTHNATLKVECSNAGIPLVTIPLHGETIGTLGDIDDDGVIGIGDVTGVISLLLTDSQPAIADINCDGKVTISDVTTLVSRLLTDE